MTVVQCLWEVFATNTSIHGFINIHRTRSFIKAIYTVTLLFFWFFVGYQVVQIFKNFFDYPTTTTVRVEYSENIKFPALSVCPLNPIKRSEFEQFRQETNMKYPILDTSMLGPLDRDWVNSDAYLQYEISKAMYNYPEKANKSGFQLDEIVTECKYNGRNCSFYGLRFKQWQHGMYGNCFTLSVSSDQYKNLPTVIGASQGLHAYFFLSIDQFLPKISPIIGAKFHIHPTTEPIFMEDEGFTVSTASMASVSMKMWKQTKDPPPYTPCQTVNKRKNEDSSLIDLYRQLDNTYENLIQNYSSPSCTKTCLLEIVIANYSCALPLLVSRSLMIRSRKDPVPPVCGDNYVQIMEGATTQAMIKHCSDQCPEPCEQRQYRTKIVSNAFPSEIYLAENLNDWTDTNDEFRTQVNEIDKFLNLTADQLMPKPKSNIPAVNPETKLPQTKSPPTPNLPNNPLESTNLGREKREHPNDASGMTDPNMMYTHLIGLAKAKMLQQQILGIQVYFEDLNSEVLEERASYTFVSLLSNAGGILGLFVGMSLFSVLELCIFLLNVAFCQHAKNEKGSGGLNF